MICGSVGEGSVTESAGSLLIQHPPWGCAVCALPSLVSMCRCKQAACSCCFCVSRACYDLSYRAAVKSSDRGAGK